MRRKFITIISLIVIIALLITKFDVIKSIFASKTAYAVGDLMVNWGVPEGNPIFTVPNWAPGQTQTRSVIVSNGAPSPRPVGIRGILTNETGSMSAAMTIEIKKGAMTLYGPKPLSTFFSDSSGPNGIPLTLINQGQNTTYSIAVTFNPQAGNEYQGKNIVFDLKIGITFDIPAACANIHLGNRLPIFGTSKSDHLNGTPQDDIIVVFEGSDIIDGKGGNDCIIGGAGDDILKGNNGNDYLFGDDGSDVLDGGNGKDYLDGGAGSDSLSGGNDNDVLYGGTGSDALNGGNGKDTIYGGDGSDSLDGGNDNDYLNGEAGIDHADGKSGIDTCIAESKVRCEL